MLSGSDTGLNINDPLYGCQWHLHNEGQLKGAGDEDINAEQAWATTLGSGVNVAVVDDGMQPNHEDLVANVDSSKNYDYILGGNDIFEENPLVHGTRVAGVIAARDNSTGMRGVAPRATVYAYNLLDEPNDTNEADAMTRNMSVTAVSNNSWGPWDRLRPSRAPRIWELAVDAGVADGFGGKGVFYVFSAGNGHEYGDYSNLDGYANYYAVTAACAVDDLGERASYSEMGANLWVCAPSRQSGRAGIATTENRRKGESFDRYVDTFGGTSAAAPQVSGVAALVRSVDRGTKSGLGWRDVKLILAGSARKNDPGDTGWETGALEYGSDPADDQRYQFNHEYGFGVVDAKAAVDLAGTWVNVPEMRRTGPIGGTGRVTIPTAGRRASITITVDSDIEFVEFVEVDVDLDALSFRDLRIELVSPSGAVSELSVPESSSCRYRPGRPHTNSAVRTRCGVDGSYRFGSARHLGEPASGRWTLRVADRLTGRSVNYLRGWSITVYGHKYTPEAPVMNKVDPGTNDLTVSWAPPGYTGASAITSYDVRYIRSSAGNKASDSAWTLVEGVGAAADRSYAIAGLDDTVRRDVQVRAVNAGGAGDWSVTARGTPGAANSEPFFAEGEEAVRVVREDATAGTAIGSPLEARDAESDTFAYSLGGPDAARFDLDSSSGQFEDEGSSRRPARPRDRVQPQRDRDGVRQQGRQRQRRHRGRCHHLGDRHGRRRQRGARPDR